MYIEVNLSIEKSGGEELIQKMISDISDALKDRFPDAEIIVRKGFFKTIDGIYSDNALIENQVRDIIRIVRERVLN